MKALFVYPKYSDTFWSFKHALKFISKTAVHPPLGLLTIASMLPRRMAKRLIEGYKKVLTGIYSLKIYYERVKAFLKEYKPLEKRKRYFHLRSIRYNLHYLDAPFKTLVILGIKNGARIYYWKLVVWSLLRRPLFRDGQYSISYKGFISIRSLETTCEYGSE